MAEREKGVAMAPCPNCGQELKQIVQDDGGVAYEACPSCYPADPVKETASAQPVKREKATPVAESPKEDA